ncbi:hypothetical protein CLAFUW4_09623 [Fulvia fulva]|uniref:Uncharacterized protein n=1 Tax=Passalora fulva TaxID=5499 RepID=A0A9Q8PFS3_PASFU|nr:uncharacterized protein CLAFUR5_09717 [Fulvia fulva]KAK4613958.1 hypothetical protein CLAFUR4_09628 [Fulvia fulva]KAK4614403.1 hypothetical protein CLAFUR0_09619 [Fulvia fulva]UJO21794.1 hypothetical protein CLAFUR5_09717 [Fulvia fulva]WPV20627.1 hypothetical protein CLAFUW4_09623 [Fulvia fulva]WPV35082.1 hypothetical protein CLAFUW7_09624 [Fulvia fulva]
MTNNEQAGGHREFIFRKIRQRAAPQPQWAQQHCRLLQLPAELRNQIWREALVKDDNERIDLAHLPKPSLLCTCRQIEAEALRIFFFANRFVLNIVITEEWRVQPYTDDSAIRWTLNAEKRGLSIAIRDVYFTFERPGFLQPAEPKRFAMQLIPRANPHFDTPVSFCLAEDQSDFPICTRTSLAMILRDLAKKGREGFRVQEIRRIAYSVRVNEIAGVRLRRWIGVPRVRRWDPRVAYIYHHWIPNSWKSPMKPPTPPPEPKCQCLECRTERREAKKSAKQVAKLDAKKKGKEQ